MSETQSTSGGIGFGGALVLLLVGLKLAGIIDWSWWWVFAPFWIPVLIALLIGVVLVILEMKK